MKVENRAERVINQEDSKKQTPSDCIPEKGKYTTLEPQYDIEKLVMDFTPQNIVQGFVFSEIIGKPKGRRRGRGF